MFRQSRHRQFSPESCYRRDCTPLNFGIPGGLAADTLVQYAAQVYGAEMSHEQAENFRQRHIHQVFPELQEYLESEPLAELLAWNLHTTPEAVREVFDQEWHLQVLRRLCNGEPYKSTTGEPYGENLIDLIWEGLSELDTESRWARAVAAQDDKTLRRLFWGSAVTLSGRVRGNLPYTASRNCAFQGAAADGAKAALWRLYQQGFQVVAFVHDEFLLTWPESANHTAAAQQVERISPAGLLIEYAYETSAGVRVQDGASAAGQIDDSGPTRQWHAFGSSVSLEPLSYDPKVPDGIGSGFSLRFPPPENAANYVMIPLVEGDGLSSITLGDFRVETWFRTTDVGRSNLVSSYVSSAEPTALNLELHTNNRGRIYVQGPSHTTDVNVTLPTDSRDGQWHHLAGVREGGIVQLYYDGDLVGSAPDVAGGYVINKPAFYLGTDGRLSGPPRLEGNLDDVRIYASADESVLIAEYLFETMEGTPVSAGLPAGDQVDDTAHIGPFHGIGSAATQPSTPTYMADVPAALSSSSVHSFAVDEQGNAVQDARIPVVPELAEITQGDFTLETWFKTTDTGRGILLGGYDGGVDVVNLELHTDNRIRIYIDGPTVTDLNVIAPVDTRDGEWHHLLGQREEDLVSIYLDGELVDSMLDGTGFYTMQVDMMYLARDSRTGATQFDGQLDNTRIWARALTESEISALAAGVVPIVGVPGDFDGDGFITATDIDLLSEAIRTGSSDLSYDLDGSGDVALGDLTTMIVDIKQTWLGDADLDGEFNSSDMVKVFVAGKYETGAAAGWEEGNWNVDGIFDSSDMVASFVDGGYEQGPRPGLEVIPEPGVHVLTLLALAGVLSRRRGQSQPHGHDVAERSGHSP